MLVLYETPAGYALFKVLDEKKLANVENLYKHFQQPEHAAALLSLKSFSKFESTTDAVTAVEGLVEGKLSKDLKKFLEKEFSKNKKDALLVGDTRLGGAIHKKLGIDVKATEDLVSELYRGIRTQLPSLIPGISAEDMSQMVLGLSHSLSRHKLKFSPDKIDTMIIQAIALLDDLDKELNTYAMRSKEWYGWHFPEMGKIIVDNLAYAKCVRAMGYRTNCKDTDFSAILPEDLEQTLKTAAEVSMGTEISELDLKNIGNLCEQVIKITEYRAQLYDYLKSRMTAIAPNLTALVGELVGARLISHAGSLLNLSKHPASTVQILGAEKALFRALKTKHDTPKYGLIYHASLIGQANPKEKGKIARVLAAKAALSIRVDALGEKATSEIGEEARAKVESQLRRLDNRVNSNKQRVAHHQQAFTPKPVSGYNASADVVKKQPTPSQASAPTPQVGVSAAEKVETNGTDEKAKKKKEKKEKRKRDETDDGAEETSAAAAVATEESADKSEKKSKKSKKAKTSSAADEDVTMNGKTTDDGSDKKLKKKKKAKATSED